MPVLRTIEKKIRRLTLAALSGRKTVSPDDPVLRTLPERPRILLIRIDRIGDGIISTPIMQALHKRFPLGKTDVLLGQKNHVLASLLPDVERCLVLEKAWLSFLKTVWTLRQNRYDIVINMHLNRSASASLIARISRGKRTVEYGQHSPFTKSIREANGQEIQHVVTMTSQLLKPLDIAPFARDEATEHPLRLAVPNTTRLRAEELGGTLFARHASKKRIFLNVSATHTSRSWPWQCYAELASALRKADLLPVLCGTPADAGTIQQIAVQSGSGALTLPPLQRYEDFAAALNLAHIVVTPDTSTVHLAAALGKPTVALYTLPKTAAAWGPWAVPHKTLANAEGVKNIKPANVVSAVLALNIGSQGMQTGISDRLP